MAASYRAARWTLRPLLAGVALPPPQADVPVAGLSLDSRRVQAGDLFFACLGRAARGHDFIPAALARGAAAVCYDAACPVSSDSPVPLVPVVDLGRRVGALAARFYGQPSRELNVIGITGTNGKTSCSHFLAQVLDEPGARCAVVGTLGSGTLERLHSSRHTTPDPISLQARLAELRAQGVQRLAMEVSSHALDQGRVEGVAFRGAVFTNLSRDHLDYHGDMAAYALAKQRLFNLPALRYAVVNGDDRYGRTILATERPGVAAVSYGLGPAVAATVPHLRGQVQKYAPHGFELQVEGPWGEGRVTVPLLGRFNAANVLAVIATALAEGWTLSTILERVARLRPVPGRMEVIAAAGRPLVVVDYAHTPDALEQALSSLRPHVSGRLWCVFGCGGERDRGKRPLMGGIAARLADRVIVTDDNPRSEDPAAIAADILAGMAPRAVPVIHARDAAIREAIGRAGAGDAVLIAGKGHEREQVLATGATAFCDRTWAARCLTEGCR
ncbi:MAG TPA: UDP-N-acetylmuramoyl-L-alanyl-D-glutamate--2,6-diaminopimelate ligase [Gammaproteobacteria bacterium]|nr:UDP-N-acetylmuramoyl-L-alanyl-D-glutamate--2,6-diaminopimelate ligase [Gammaproteobacteria bacterium]